MALLIEEEEDDSAIESDDDQSHVERKMKRTLSRLHSHNLSLARADSVQSRSSHRTSLLMESQLSILTSETEISIFVSLKTGQDKTTLLYFTHNTVDRPGTAGSKR